MLIKFYNQITESRQAVVHRHRCGLGGFAIAAILAEIAVAATEQRAENSKSFKLCKLNFSYFLKFDYDVFKIILYILFKAFLQNK